MTLTTTECAKSEQAKSHLPTPDGAATARSEAANAAVVNVTSVIFEQPSLSLGDRMDLMKQHREMINDPDFDPESLELEIDDNVEETMTKVDNTIAWIQTCEDHAANCSRRAEEFAAEARVAANNAKRSRDYVLFKLKEHDRTDIGGHTYIIRKVPASNKPKVVPVRGCSMEDLVAFGETIVRTVPPGEVRYEWDKNAIYARLKSPTPEDIKDLRPLFELDYGEKLDFDPVGKPETKPRKKKK